MKPKPPDFINDMTEIYVEADPEIVQIFLKRPDEFIEDTGYENRVDAIAVHPEKGWVAWVEFRSKEINRWRDVSYTLKAIVNDTLVINWNVKSYNPFFGCYVHHFRWYQNWVEIIYSEKHAIYAVTLSVTGDLQPVQIGSLGFPWGLYDQVIACRHIGETQVRRWILPDLTPLPTLTQEEAIKADILEEIRDNFSNHSNQG